jgi:hypothetical protein
MALDDGLSEEIGPVAIGIARRVQLLTTTVRIHDLSITRPAVVAYLRGIPADKQELALIHALDVGVAEILSRRRRANEE